MKKIEVIELNWDGPFSLDHVTQNFTDKTGLYQIYGTHPIFGKNKLLYIGKTEDSFNARFKSHASWIEYEYDPVQIYIGEIQRSDMGDKESIEIAERLLIFYCAPPYNSNNIVQAKTGITDREILVVNHGKISELLPCVTNLNDSDRLKDSQARIDET